MKDVARLLDDLAKEMRRASKSVDIDAVHDLRVSVRRASEALRVFEDQIPKAKRLRKEIKAIRERAAAVRDRDVIRQSLRRHRLPVADPAYVYLRGQRDLAAVELRDFLVKELDGDPLSRWSRLPESANGASAGKMEPLVENFFAAGKKAAASHDRHELHAFRVTAKRLRYAIEILDPAGSAARLRALRAVQRRLGDLNDAFVAEQYIRALPSRSAQARTLPPKLRAETRRHIDAFQKTWKRRFGPGSEKAWLTWARQAG